MNVKSAEFLSEGQKVRGKLGNFRFVSGLSDQNHLQKGTLSCFYKPAQESHLSSISNFSAIERFRMLKPLSIHVITKYLDDTRLQLSVLLIQLHYLL